MHRIPPQGDLVSPVACHSVPIPQSYPPSNPIFACEVLVWKKLLRQYSLLPFRPRRVQSVHDPLVLIDLSHCCTTSLAHVLVILSQPEPLQVSIRVLDILLICSSILGNCLP